MVRAVDQRSPFRFLAQIGPACWHDSPNVLNLLRALNPRILRRTVIPKSLEIDLSHHLRLELIADVEARGPLCNLGFTSFRWCKALVTRCRLTLSDGNLLRLCTLRPRCGHGAMVAFTAGVDRSGAHRRFDRQV